MVSRSSRVRLTRSRSRSNWLNPLPSIFVMWCPSAFHRLPAEEPRLELRPHGAPKTPGRRSFAPPAMVPAPEVACASPARRSAWQSRDVRAGRRRDLRVEYPPDMPRRDAAPRPIVAAELLSIGSELTTGETRDTNGGELARSLSTRGLTVLRIQAL